MTSRHGHVHDIVVLGASHAGLGLAATLARTRAADVTVLDPAPDLTSVARHTPSIAPALLHDYQVIDPHDWPHLYPTVGDQADYLRRLAAVLARPVQLQTDVVGLSRGTDTTPTWVVTGAHGGQHVARSVVVDAERWPRPSPPPRGLAQFRGTVIDTHTVEPDDVAGQRVGLVAPPSQIATLLPFVVEAARHVKVFQPDASWVLPRPNPHLPRMARRALHLPPVRHAAHAVMTAGHFGMDHIATPTRALVPLRDRLARRHLHSAVADPWARERLTPARGHRQPHPTPASSSYYATLQHPTCELISWPVAGISVDGVRTADGIEHHVDVLVVPAPHPIALAVTGEPVATIDESGSDLAGLALPDLHVLPRPPVGRGPAEWVEAFARRMRRQLDHAAA